MSEVFDWYDKIPDDMRKVYHNPKKKIHGLEIPFRILVIAASGSGKTNFILQLIHDTSGTFEHITVCVKNKEEPLYKFLEKKVPPESLTFYENVIPPMTDFENYSSSFIIFDDLVNTKSLQPAIAEYAIRGRKKGISMAYLTQSYYAVPKIIRVQMNYIIIKKLNSEKDLKLILREYNFGIDFDQLMELYNQATQIKKNWLMIDLDHSDKKFRFNWKPINIRDKLDHRNENE